MNTSVWQSFKQSVQHFFSAVNRLFSAAEHTFSALDELAMSGEEVAASHHRLVSMENSAKEKLRRQELKAEYKEFLEGEQA